LKSFPDPASSWNLRFSELKAEILVRQRFTTEALALLTSPLPPALASSDLAVWRKLTEAMANVYALKLAEGEALLGDAQTLARQNHPELLGEVALRRGALAFWRGDAPAAETAYRDALERARANGDPFLETAALGSLGLAATKQEHYDQSIQWNQQALRQSRAIAAQDSESYILGNMGWAYFEIGDYDRALESLQQAKESSHRVGSVGAEIDWLIEIGGVEYYLRDYMAAERESRRALVLARGLDAKSAITQSLNNLCAIALKRDDLLQAEKYNAEALALASASNDRSGEISSTLLQGRIENAKGNYAAAEQFFQRIATDSAAETALRWEAQARLADVYRASRSPVKADAAYRGAISTVETARSSIDDEELRVAFLSKALEFYDAYVDFLVERGRPRDALEIAELSRSRTLAEGLGASRKPSLPLPGFHPEQIARQNQATLLLYWLGQKRSILWVITSGQVTCLTLAPSNDIDPLVRSYREAVLSGRDVLEGGNPDGKKLYSLLLEPARRFLPPGSRVVLLPDGSLYGLNFEILIAPEPKPHFWIEDVTLSTASSITLLAASAAKSSSAGLKLAARRAQSANASQGRLLLVGNAVSSSADFPPLRQSASEIDHVGHYFPEPRLDVLAGAQATPAAFLQRQPGSFAYLHFVTHGTASRTHPLDSAVILSPEGADAGSFKLYAREIVKQRLSAQLVTISACNGSGTRAFSGEGLVGLSWAFLRAGAHNVIAALWEVNDASTPQLMDALYAELARGQAPADALRTAKLALLHSDSVFRKPFYWAPFQLYSGS
jgi:CHAT domain-containing protein